ncbi:uncharacterized protein LOC127079261 [Lathyrus oleraceus]|uniref:uncharacterized protein LOC127079261 n=1 Tax=Pisum sativum TaxID=3888 RepID=UPI0021CFF26A|nr:uncharacterized protein LOC127079261 [Pisum sativum]
MKPNPPLPDYIKPQFPIIKKKPVQEDEEVMLAKFKEMLATLQAFLKGTKEKVVKEQVNMTEKDEVVRSQALPPKLKDPSKFIISCNIGEVNIRHALCDLGSSINVMPLKTVKEMKVGEIMLSIMTLTLAASSITQPVNILCDVLVDVEGLVFPTDFLVLDTKGTSGGFVILKRPFLATGKAKIYVETGELILKFNKKKFVFKVYYWTSYVESLDTCYHL